MKNSGIEWIGEIPDSWKVAETKFLFDIFSGATPDTNSSVNWDGNINWITPADFKSDDVYVIKGKKSITTQGLNSCSAKLVPENSLIFSKRAPIGAVAITRSELCTNQGCLSCVNKGQVVTKYYYYVMRAAEEIYELYGAGTTFKEIAALKFANFILPYPSVSEQETIQRDLSNRIKRVDKLIEVQHAQIDKLKEYKQSVITEAVTKGLDPTVPMKDVSSWMRRIPCNWFDPKIKYFCSIESGGTPERTHPEYWNGDINWFKTGELHNDEIFDSEEKITVKAIEETAAKIFPRNTILVAMYGQGKTRGMTALLKKESATNQACAAIQLKTKIYEVNYLWWVLKGAYNSLREQANGSGQPNLSVSLINEFEISLPPLLEQQKIICYLDDKCAKIDKLIAIKQAKIDKLQEYKKSLIYEYVTGKREVM